MIFTVPNAISVVRIAAVPAFLWLLLGRDSPTAAGWLLAAIASTDWVDGFLARRLGQISEVGKFLDPAADRLAVAAAVAAGWISGHLPWPVALAIAIRESAVVLGALALAARAASKLEVRYMGKVATFGVYAAIPGFLISSGTGTAWLEVTAWVIVIPSLALYYIVAAQYLGDMRSLMGERGAVSSQSAIDEENSG